MLEKIIWVKANLGDPTVARLVAALTKKDEQTESGGCGCGCGDGSAPRAREARTNRTRA